MILHLATDEKFIDAAYSIFNGILPNENKFLIVSSEKKLKYVKSAKYELITFKELYNPDFIIKLNSYDFVIFHSLLNCFKKLILRMNPKVKILWIGWGFDYYGQMTNCYPRNLLFEKTNTLYSKNMTIINLLKSNFGLLKRLFDNTIHFSRIAKRVDYFAPVLPNEYELCKKHISGLKAEFISWNYIDNIEENKSDNISGFGNDILLGNSASYTNNHYEAIDILSTIKIDSSRKVYVPLSYGDNKYRDCVINYGKSKLGNIFVPLVDFMPQEEYWKIIASCKFVLMNHLRQQAMGNIVVKIYNGSSVFFQPNNPCFQFFKNIGVKVFDIGTLAVKKNIEEFDLTDEEINANKRSIISYFGKNAILQKTANLITKIKEGIK
ncbi:MAG: TDP-N-acetylfucosamine:lipid II N-acetylfucosaminyltransferase [Candidatus Gastranaerophilales bacterium]|nr:TDP-N-acetylfucosamine:lipid II N-acetylfucosaminyltransferase [Candidatus Gastranaerophilales bacterium]